ncbi:DUF5615 family PIN-like protein [Candidatus Poriferisodalis sp.]
MRWLLDEMFPPAAAAELQRLGHDARGVAASALAGSPDAVPRPTLAVTAG